MIFKVFEAVSAVLNQLHCLVKAFGDLFVSGKSSHAGDWFDQSAWSLQGEHWLEQTLFEFPDNAGKQKGKLAAADY